MSDSEDLNGTKPTDKLAGHIAITVKCDLDSDEIFGRVHVEAQLDRTLDWVLNEFCREKNVTRKPTFALRNGAGTELKLGSTLAESNLRDGGLIFVYNKGASDEESGQTSQTASIELLEAPFIIQYPPKPPPSSTTATLDNAKLSMWYLMAALAFLIAVAGVVTIVVIWSLYTRPVNAYIAIVDAGSTSSKIYLYTWQDYPTRTNGFVRELTNKKVDPGISSYESNPSGCSAPIVTVLNNTIIPLVNPPSMLAKAPLYLGATAGMRMLSQTNNASTQAIFAALRKDLPAVGFKVDSAIDSIRIISGAEEATNAWITVNQVSGNLGQSQSTPTNTYGSLDLGGASTQIAFIPDPSNIQSRAEITDLKLYGVTYSVYGHSFLCYGKTQAELRFLAVIANSSNFATSVPNPCLQQGTTISMTVYSIFTAPCVSGKYAIENFGSEINPPSSMNPNSTISFIGQPDVAQCRRYTAMMFNQGCNYTSCSFNGVYQPTVRGNFLAFAGYYYVISYLNQTAPQNRGRKPTMTEYMGNVSSFCGKSWPEVKPSDPTQESIIKWYCFDAVYIEKLLQGMGFNDANWQQITFVDSVSGNTIGWALGFSIDASGKIPVDKPWLTMDLLTFILLLILFCCFFLIGGALLFVACYHHRLFRLPFIRYNDDATHRAQASSSAGGYGAI